MQGDAEHDGLAGSGVVQLNVIFFTLKLSRGPFAGILSRGWKLQWVNVTGHEVGTHARACA